MKHDDTSQKNHTTKYSMGRKVISQGYQPCYLFRPVLWNNRDVAFWYRQNTFLYAKTGSAANEALLRNGLAPMANTAMMDCGHPELHELSLRRGSMGHKIRNVVRPIIPSAVLKAITRR